MPVAAYAWHEDGRLQLRQWVAAMTVYLVGAGPGDPGLLTVRGRELVEACDALVYDRLVDDRIVALAGEGCERHYAGKRPGEHAMTQDVINALLVELGRRHETVVRLKGGDPFIFGRGGEEALDARRGGHPVRGRARRLVGLRRAGLRRHPGHAARHGRPGDVRDRARGSGQARERPRLGIARRDARHARVPDGRRRPRSQRPRA